MRRKDIIVGMEVAISRSDNDRPEYGTVESTNAARRVFRGSRDFRGTEVHDGIAVRVREDQVRIVPNNQVKDAEETRAMWDARDNRRVALEASIRRQRADAEDAITALGTVGIRAELRARHAYGDYRITGWEVGIGSSTALELAAKLIGAA